MGTTTKKQVTSVGFKRWRKRQPWTCRECGALTNDPRLHASFHASLAGARHFGDIGMWSEGGHYLSVSVDENGTVL